MRAFPPLPVLFVCLSAVGLVAFPAHGHGFKTGGITLEHPYIVVKPGSTQAALQFLRVRNAGASPDRLMQITCAHVAAVSFHHVGADGGMQRDASIDLPANSALALRHDGARHVMLDGVARALTEGDALQCRALFERAPALAFDARVQTPRPPKDATPHAGH